MSVSVSATDLDLRVQPYLDAVRAAMGAVPPAEQAEFLEDVTSHLLEVASEGPGDLELRLGSPAVYATEVVTAAGYDTPGSPSASPEGARDNALRSWWRRSPAVAELREIAPQVWPGWWVLRPFLVVAGVLVVLSGGRLADEAEGLFVGALAAVLAVPTSIRWGRSRALHRRRDLAVTVAAAVGLVLAANAVLTLPRYRFVDSGSSYLPGVMTRADGTPITNIHAYDAAGNPVDVYLYDQDGRPLDDVARFTTYGRRIVTDFPLDANGQPILNAYPLRQPGVPPPAVSVPPAAAESADSTTTTPSATATTTAPSATPSSGPPPPSP